MDHASVLASETEAHTERRCRILDAAERCFARAGFHRSTMQDVAAEAGMSPGNLYRYFPSKDAMVEGLAERDRARIVEDFSALQDAEDFVAGFAAIGRKHFVEEPRKNAVLCLETWAEATRNPAFARITEQFDKEILGRLQALFENAQARGAIADGDARSLALIVSLLANGLFVRKAVAADFDPIREVGLVIAVMEAAFAGKMDLARRPDARSNASQETSQGDL